MSVLSCIAHWELASAGGNFLCKAKLLLGKSLWPLSGRCMCYQGLPSCLHLRPSRLQTSLRLGRSLHCCCTAGQLLPLPRPALPSSLPYGHVSQEPSLMETSCEQISTPQFVSREATLKHPSSCPFFAKSWHLFSTNKIILEHLGLFTAENSTEKEAVQLWLVAERLPFAEQVPGSCGCCGSHLIC